MRRNFDSYCKISVSTSVVQSDIQSDDQRVGGLKLVWSLHCCVASLDKKLCSTLFLFSQVYKLLPVTYC